LEKAEKIIECKCGREICIEITVEDDIIFVRKTED